MKGPKHISLVFIEMAASNSDPLGRPLRKLPFIQAELLKRKIISLDDLSDDEIERFIEWDQLIEDFELITVSVKRLE